MARVVKNSKQAAAIRIAEAKVRIAERKLKALKEEEVELTKAQKESLKAAIERTVEAIENDEDYGNDAEGELVETIREWLDNADSAEPLCWKPGREVDEDADESYLEDNMIDGDIEDVAEDLAKKAQKLFPKEFKKIEDAIDAKEEDDDEDFDESAKKPGKALRESENGKFKVTDFIDQGTFDEAVRDVLDMAADYVRAPDDEYEDDLEKALEKGLAEVGDAGFWDSEGDLTTELRIMIATSDMIQSLDLTGFTKLCKAYDVELDLGGDED